MTWEAPATRDFFAIFLFRRLAAASNSETRACCLSSASPVKLGSSSAVACADLMFLAGVLYVGLIVEVKLPDMLVSLVPDSATLAKSLARFLPLSLSLAAT